MCKLNDQMIHISIIIPTYNRAGFILETLDSLRLQSNPNWECILVDDHSTDETAEFVQEYIGKYPQLSIKFLKNTRKKGAQGARNTGIEHASGNYLMFLDSDDLLLPFAIESRIQVVTQNPGFDYYCFKTKVLNPDGSTQLKYHLQENHEDDIVRFLKFKNPWHTMGCLLKNEIVQELGVWDENLLRFQDCEYYLRLVLKTKLRAFKARDIEPDNLFRANYGSESITSSKKFDEQSQLSLLHFMTKVQGLLVEQGAFKKYSEDYLYLVLYVYTIYLMPFGKLPSKFAAFYDKILMDIGVNAYLRSIYQYYFKYRGSEAVSKNIFLKASFKLIPKIFRLSKDPLPLW